MAKPWARRRVARVPMMSSASKAIAGKVGDPGGATKIAAVFELVFQLHRRGWSMRFIRRVQLAAIRMGLFGVEGAGDIFGLFQLDQLVQKLGETVNGIGRLAFGIGHFFRISVPAAKNIDAGIDQVGAFLLIIGIVPGHGHILLELA